MQELIGLIVQITGLLVLIRFGWQMLKRLFRSLYPAPTGFIACLRAAYTPRRMPMAVPEVPNKAGLRRLPAPSDWDLPTLETPTCLRRQQNSPSVPEADATFN